MKKFGFLVFAGFIGVMPVATVMAGDLSVPPGTTVVVDPSAGGTTIIAPPVSAVQQVQPEGTAPATQTTVVVDPSKGPRDAITNKPVKEKTANEDKPSLRDKVRDKMEEEKAHEDEKLKASE